MAAPYDVETYLLDKANIQEPMVRMVRKIRLFLSFLKIFSRFNASSAMKHADLSPTDAQLRHKVNLDAH